MKEIRLAGIFIMCFALFCFTLDGVSAQETAFVWELDKKVYYMISPPYMPEDRDPQVSLTDNLGSYNKIYWRFFRYDPERGAYAELKSIDWESVRHDFDFGRGYWIISLNPTEIDIEGESIGDAAEKLTILEHAGDGWNQIGNIFNYNFPIASLYVARTDDPDPWNNKVQLIDPVNNDLTYVTLQEFENGDYVDIPDIAIGKTNLETGKAYWLKVNDAVDADVILWFVIGGPNVLSNQILLTEEFIERVAQQDNPPDPPPAIEDSYSFSFGGSSGGGGGGCFIATAAYGNYDHPNVQILRGFRDRYLSTSGFGRMLVGFYYQYSPALARFAGKHKSIKALTRFNLVPLIGMSTIVSKMDVYAYFAIMASLLLGGFFFLRRRQRVLGRWKVKHSSKSKEGKRKR
jgi:hypothetical protein